MNYESSTILKWEVTGSGAGVITLLKYLNNEFNNIELISDAIIHYTSLDKITTINKLVYSLCKFI